jgi:hypothetical protein
VYLRFDSPAGGRVLEPGVLEEIAGGRWTVAFGARHQPLAIGDEKLLYYNRAREFFQQAVCVESPASHGPPYIVTLTLVGDATSAGTRSEDRVEASGFGLEATVAGEPGCAIHDVSLSGLAVIASRTHAVGQRLEISIRFDNDEFRGEMEVRVATRLGEGRTQYGLLGIFVGPHARSLKSGLTKLTLGIQQRRLQRIAGSS